MHKAFFSDNSQTLRVCRTWKLVELQEFLFYLPPYMLLCLIVAHGALVTGRLFQQRHDALPEGREVRLLQLERWHNLEGDTLQFIEILGAKGQREERRILLDEVKKSRRSKIIRLGARNKETAC